MTLRLALQCKDQHVNRCLVAVKQNLAKSEEKVSSTQTTVSQQDYVNTTQLNFIKLGEDVENGQTIALFKMAKYSKYFDNF